MIQCAWLTPFFLSHGGGARRIFGAEGKLIKVSHTILVAFSSPAILKLKEDTEDPSLKAVFDQQIFVSGPQGSLCQQGETVQPARYE